jgi:hypothetical protein
MKSGNIVTIEGHGQDTFLAWLGKNAIFIGSPDENQQAPDPQVLRKEWKRRQFLPGTLAKRAGIALSEVEAFYRGEETPKSTLIRLSQALFREFARTGGKAFSSFTCFHELSHLGWVLNVGPEDISGEVKKD